MNIINAALAAIILVIVTMSIREWIQAIKEALKERRKQHKRRKYYYGYLKDK